MDLDAHWQAMYDALRAGLDTAGLTDVPLAAIHSQDSQTAGEALVPPYVIYSGERETGTGTTGSGQNKVALSGWRVTCRARDLDEVLAMASAVTAKMEQEDIDQTADGYVTTAVELVGGQTLYEIDSKLNSYLLRFNWERSK